MYHPIRNADELDVLAKVDQSIYDILTDRTFGRRAAALEITMKGFSVTDKVVRTWREKNLGEVNHNFTMPMINQFGENVNPLPKVEHVIDYGQYREGEPNKILTTTGTVITIPEVKNPKFTFNVVKSRKDDKRVVAFGDFQINKHDPELLEKAVAFVKAQQPDMICLTGDESDNTAVGQWARGMKDEFEVSLQGQIDETIDWLTKIREAAPKAEIHMAHSNHMHWITKAIETRLPGLATLKALTPESLYQLKDLDIQYQRKIFEFLPNFLLAHGHQWKLTSGSHRTKGIQEVMRTGCSILAGHVHQAALETTFIGYEGKGEQKVYVNAGCMMDFEKSMASNGGYNAGTSPNWSSGIVVITREAGRNFTELLLSQDKMFRYEGKLY